MWREEKKKREIRIKWAIIINGIQINHTVIDACVIKTLPSTVTIAVESCVKGEPFFSQWIFGVGTPNGGLHVISARPPASTRTDCGDNLNCFLISAKWK